MKCIYVVDMLVYNANLYYEHFLESQLSFVSMQTTCSKKCTILHFRNLNFKHFKPNGEFIE